MTKAIVFDLDDTLLMTRETKYAALKFAGEKFYNLQISDKDLNLHWGKPFSEFLELVFNNAESPELMAKKYKSIVRLFKNKPYPDTLATLNILKKKYKLSILSSAAKSLIEYDLECAKVPFNTFSYIQSAEDTSVHKPDPNVFSPLIKIMSQHRIVPNQMIYIGDMINDFQAARGAGLNFIGIANRSTPKKTFDRLKVKTIASLAELPNIF